MKKCSNCNDPNQEDDARFCDYCRHPFSAAAKPARSPVMTPTPIVSSLPPTKPAGTCPNCGWTVLPGASFCEHCRASLQGGQSPTPGFPTPLVSMLPPTRLSLSCAACKAPLNAEQRFCSHCGKPVASGSARDQATELLEADGPGRNVTGPRLVITGGAAFPLSSRGEMYIGRDDPEDLHAPGVDLGPHGGAAGGVSRRHARLAWRDGRWTIEDLNSMNYTYVNNRRLGANEPCVLQHGDQIRVGRLVLTYYAH